MYYTVTMIKADELAAIDLADEESENSRKEEYNVWNQDPEDPEENEGKTYTIIPILQMAVCALLLVALVYFKFADEIKFKQAVSWYQAEAAQEVEIPQFEKKNAVPPPESQTPPSTAPTANQTLEII